MATNFPTTLDSYTTHNQGDTINNTDVNNPQDAIVALETKLGVDSSAVTTTLDFKVKNPASVDPGHHHTNTSLDSLATSKLTGLTALANGGTNADLSATGGTSQVLKQVSAGAAVTVAQLAESDISFTDITTNNVSTTKHGLVPKAPADSTKFLDGTGAFSTPIITGGDWQQLGETTLAATAQTISVSSFPARKDIKIVLQLKAAATISGGGGGFQFNGDSSTNYNVNKMFLVPGGTSVSTSTGSAQTSLSINDVDMSSGDYLTVVLEATNTSSFLKLITGQHTLYVASRTSPSVGQANYSAWWNNTSAQITTVTFTTGASNTLAIGTRMTIYGKKD